MLAIDNLTFAWPDQQTPYTFSLDVAPGQIVAITGASGAGKSTLLDLIAGFETPRSGSLALDNRNLLPLPPEKRPVSILFQSDNLFDHLSAAANLDFALKGAPRAERSNRIAQALEEVGLEGFASRKTANLSGGQKQRVALARTLLRSQPVLLLDEPFNGLDEQTAKETRALVARLSRNNGWHVILVSHDRSDIQDLATKEYRVQDFTLHPA